MLKDDKGIPFEIKIKQALYVPDCPMRLICPQQLIAQTGNSDDIFGIKGKEAALRLGDHTVTIPYNEGNNLPILMTEPGIKRYSNFICHECTPL